MENNTEFQRLAGLAKSLTGDYGRGYSRGVRRRFYDSRFGTEEEHERWMEFEGSRAELSRGYRDALEGRNPQPDPDGGRPDTWPPSDVRAWVDRHGGNVSACARRLRVPRTLLQAWMSEAPYARELPAYMQAAMETIDELEALRAEG